jgi:hypothetical protein
MAYSYQEYPADGTNRNFTVPFDYVKQSEVKVYIDGVETTAFEFPSANVITLDTAPTSGQTVRIGRNTDLQERAVDFVAGAVLSEEDLDTALIQIFNGSQEAVDIAGQALRADLDGRADMQNRQVKGIVDPTEPDHAVNLNFIQNEYGNVTAVKANEANITTVSTNITDVNTVADNIADINRIEDSIDNVDSVASNIDTLDANYENIEIVADNIGDVANLAAQIDDIAVVAASFVTSETAPPTANAGDRWYQPSTNILFLYGEDTVNGGYTWFEAAQYQVLRDYVFDNIASARSSFSGSDSNGNTVNIPVGANVQVIVNGLNLVPTVDFTIGGTQTVNLSDNVPAGSSVEIRVHTPMLTDEYTWFEARRNETESARDYANTYQANALSYKNDSEDARDLAYQHMVDAQAHRDNAEAYKDTALVYRDAANTSKNAAAASATTALSHANDAAASAASAARQDMDFGSVSLAGLGFVDDTDTGIYHPTTNTVGITSGGVNSAQFSNTTVTIPSNITLDAPKRNRGLVQMVSWSNSQTKQEASTSYVDLRHSAVNFTPKFSDSMIIYEFNWTSTWKDTHGIGHYRVYRAGSEQTAWRLTVSGQNLGTRVHHGARFGSWGAGVTQQIKIMFREYNSSNEMWAHATQYWDGVGTDVNSASWGRVMEWRD